MLDFRLILITRLKKWKYMPSNYFTREYSIWNTTVETTHQRNIERLNKNCTPTKNIFTYFWLILQVHSNLIIRFWGTVAVSFSFLACRFDRNICFLRRIPVRLSHVYIGHILGKKSISFHICSYKQSPIYTRCWWSFFFFFKSSN